MFSSLRANNQVYILHKSDPIHVDIATVLSVSTAMPTLGGFPQQPTYVVDVTVKVGDSTITYSKLPSNADVADWGNNGNLVVACSREAINTFDMERTEDFLQKHGITLKNDTLYDKVYVLNMAIADYFMSSIPDEQRLANFVRDTLDDYDGCDDSVFRRYIATEIGKGDPIEWNDML